MCTVVIRVARGSAWPVTMLALRDESPGRPWDPIGRWWPDRDSSVRGVRDRAAGGAWLAASDRNGLAVVLNRAEVLPAEDAVSVQTRGRLPLDAVADGWVPQPGDSVATRAANLVTATADGVTITSWDGAVVRRTELEDGVHMVTHGACDDRAVPRVARWLPAFLAVPMPVGPPARALPTGALPVGAVLPAAQVDDGWESWLGVLAESAALAPEDPAALVRDEVGFDGHVATLSVVTAAVAADRVVLQHARLGQPGRFVTASATVEAVAPSRDGDGG